MLLFSSFVRTRYSVVCYQNSVGSSKKRSCRILFPLHSDFTFSLIAEECFKKRRFNAESVRRLCVEGLLFQYAPLDFWGNLIGGKLQRPCIVFAERL